MIGITNSGGGIGKLYAIISVTYPEGSVCTCTNGTKTLKAKDTSGKALFNVPIAGTWTITAKTTDGSKEKSVDVAITAAGQVKSVTLSYTLWLYKDGDENESITGGWGTSGYSHPSRTIAGATKQTDCMKFIGDGTLSFMLGTLSAIDLSEYSTLSIDWQGTSGSVNISCNVLDTKSLGSDIAYLEFGTASSRRIDTIDISQITGSKYIAVTVGWSSGCQGSVFSISLS